jgi:hypothetical protein
MPDRADIIENLKDQWLSKWDEAVKIWSPYVQLRKPLFCTDEKDEKTEGLSGSFAMIRLTDFSVVVSLRQIHELKLDDYPMEILAHEAGHHIYCPADLSDSARLIARIRKAIQGHENQAPMIGNLYGDLLINDRLFRENSLKMDKVYMAVKGKSSDKFWDFYMRTYEILWSLPRQTLTVLQVEPETEGDAILAARVVRNFARDWLNGAGEFAAICYHYLLESNGPSDPMNRWMDALEPGDGKTIPAGLAAIEEGEPDKTEGSDGIGKLHPSEITGQPQSKPEKSYREPFEYGQILRAIGIDLSDDDIAVKYYTERAIPYLIPFPSIKQPESKEPNPEGVAEWDISSPFEDLSMFDSLLRSPVLIPGYTTVERVTGTSPGGEPSHEPLDLDIYIDSSGSMPDPRVNTSYLTLAGAIICLSALRAGSKVQATLWSGTDEFITTKGFVRDKNEIMRILTGFFGGATAFPIHILRDTYSSRRPSSRKVHILVISDDGVTTMFDNDEKGNSGYEIAKISLEKCGGGGTFALNLYTMDDQLKSAAAMGWNIYPVTDWNGLIEFSRDFVKKHYEVK